MSDWTVVQDNSKASPQESASLGAGPGPSPQQQQGGDSGGGDMLDLIPNVTGTIGSMIGEAAGTPLDVFSGPGGTMAGGAIGGGIGGAVGGALEEGIKAMEGKGFNAGNIGSNAIEQGAYGAIPGISEGKLGAKIGSKLLGNAAKNGIAKAAGRTLMRGAGGAIGGGVAQATSDISSGQTPGSDVLSAGATTGAVNALAPGVGKILGAAKTLPAVAAFGKAGLKIPDIVKETGKIKGGTGEQMASNLFHQTGQTSALEDKMQDILGRGNGVTRAQISQALDEAIGEQSGISGALGDQQRQFKTDALGTLDDMLVNNPDTPAGVRYVAGQPMTSAATMEQLQKDNTPIPTTLVQQLMERIRRETPQGSFMNPHGPFEKTQVSAQGKLQDLVRKSLSTPEDVSGYNNINSMRQAASTIGGALRGGQAQGGFEKAVHTLGGQNPILELLTLGGGSLLPGGPFTGAALAAAERALTNPKNATKIAQSSGNKAVGKFGKGMLLRGAGAAGGALSNSQQ